MYHQSKAKENLAEVNEVPRGWLLVSILNWELPVASNQLLFLSKILTYSPIIFSFLSTISHTDNRDTHYHCLSLAIVSHVHNYTVPFTISNYCIQNICILLRNDVSHYTGYRQAVVFAIKIKKKTSLIVHSGHKKWYPVSAANIASVPAGYYWFWWLYFSWAMAASL